jgi:hypothetical protein
MSAYVPDWNNPAFPGRIFMEFDIIILTYLLTPWSRVLLEKLTSFAASQEIPRILWNIHKLLGSISVSQR